jgi:hypothetical protein
MMPRPKNEENLTLQERRDRMKRRGTIGGYRLKLGYPEGFTPDERFVYRWVNDASNGRIAYLTKEDVWDFVTPKGPVRSPEGAFKKQVGSKENGDPLFAYFLQKPREYYEEDKQAMMNMIDETMNDFRSVPESSTRGLGRDSGGYVPSSGIKIQ